jgi:hypothetical protein
VPEVPQEIVPEKKTTVLPPKKPEVSTVTGTCHTILILKKKHLFHLENKCRPLPFKNLSVTLLISFKCLKLLKKLSLRRKDQWCLLKSQNPHLSQVYDSLPLLCRGNTSLVLKNKCSLCLFINVKLLISFKCLKLLKKLSLKRKDQWCLLKSQKPHLSQVLVT